MAKHRKENPKRTMMRYIRSAFAEAKIGNTEHARSLMESAIQFGYTPDEKRIRGFELAIQQGIRDTQR